MADHRDTNHDGKVSFMEKVKDKLHMGGHKDDTYTTTTTHHTTSSTTHNSGLHTTTGGLHTTTTGYTTGTTGYNTGVPVTGAVPIVGAVPVVGSGLGVHDSRDLNHDGHVSAGERLVSGATHGSTGSTYGSTHTHATHGSTIGTHAAHGATIGTSTVGEEARLRLHEEQLAISKREVGAGEVGIHKRVHEENVVHTVPVRREEVIVERRPLSGIADPHAHISNQDETLRVALHREEVVTEKRVVPTEEVIVRKKQVTDHQQVGATLRSEHLETVQTGVTTGAYATGTGLHAGSGLHNTTGVHDARDTNLDGHVSVGEKLKGATHR